MMELLENLIIASDDNLPVINHYNDHSYETFQTNYAFLFKLLMLFRLWSSCFFNVDKNKRKT